MGKQLTWAEIEKWPAADKRQWLISICPPDKQVVMGKIIDVSALDRSDLMLYTLALYAYLAKDLNNTAKKQDIAKLDARIKKHVTNAIQKSGSAEQQTWKDYVRTPQGVVAAVIVVLLLLNLIF